MQNEPFWKSALKLNKSAVFAVKLAVAHWFDGDTTREEAVEQAASAIARHMRQTGQAGNAGDWHPVDIMDALFAHNFTGSEQPCWFAFCAEDELAEEIGERTLELLDEQLPLAA